MTTSPLCNSNSLAISFPQPTMEVAAQNNCTMEVVLPAYSCSSPSLTSFPTAAGHYHSELNFVSSEALEQWLGSDECLHDSAAWGHEGSGSGSAGHDDHQSGSAPSQPLAPAAPAPKRRGRKLGSRTNNGPVISHVEAERQRRDKLNLRFYELRAAVPKVTRMDKASVLMDAAAYIAELRSRVERLEAEAKQAATTPTTADAAAAAAVTCGNATLADVVSHSLTSFGGFHENLEVRMVGQETAALRLTTASHAHAHAPARFMLALRSLDLPVQHACVCRVGGVTVQDAVVEVPAAALRSDRGLRVALHHSLQRFAAI